MFSLTPQNIFYHPQNLHAAAIYSALRYFWYTYFGTLNSIDVLQKNVIIQFVDKNQFIFKPNDTLDEPKTVDTVT